MGKTVTGTVVEKSYRPVAGAPASYWCYLLVETEAGRRVSIRLHQRIHDTIIVGDRVQFEKPWRKNKRVQDVRVVRG